MTRTAPLVTRAMRLGAVLAAFASAPAYGECPTDDVFTNFEGCGEIWAEIGLPETLKDIDGDALIEVCHLGYATLYNTETKNPEWVIERLTDDMVEPIFKRPTIGFKADPCVDRDQSARNTDYTNSGYARGHQAASADFSFDSDWMKDTFFFSNAVPQIGGGFNSSIWKRLEEKLRTLTANRGVIFVITGPVYREPGSDSGLVPKEQNTCGREIVLPAIKREFICGGKSKKPELDCEDGVEIPIALFKIIYDPAAKKANAYIIPNISHTKLRKKKSVTDYINDWQVSVQNVEERVEHDFFTEFTTRQSRLREESCPATMIR